MTDTLPIWGWGGMKGLDGYFYADEVSGLSPEEFCDWLEKRGSHRFSAFNAGWDGFKEAIQNEMQSRGYIVRWFSDHTDMTWARPEGYLTRRDWLLELTMAMRTYGSLANSPDRSIHTDATPDQLREAVSYLRTETDAVARLPEGDFGPRKKQVYEQLEAMLT